MGCPGVAREALINCAFGESRNPVFQQSGHLFPPVRRIIQKFLSTFGGRGEFIDRRGAPMHAGQDSFMVFGVAPPDAIRFLTAGILPFHELGKKKSAHTIDLLPTGRPKDADLSG